MKDPRTEAQVSKGIVEFLRTVGFAVYSVEQGYRKERGGTRQTPGIPDLIVMGHGLFTFAEVKRDGAKLRPAQEQFRDCAAENNVSWQLWRSSSDAFDWLVAVGFIEEER
jgi:hypothetical protein